MVHPAHDAPYAHGLIPATSFAIKISGYYRIKETNNPLQNIRELLSYRQTLAILLESRACFSLRPVTEGVTTYSNDTPHDRGDQLFPSPREESDDEDHSSRCSVDRPNNRVNECTDVASCKQGNGDERYE